jgi:hypothetical protein
MGLQRSCINQFLTQALEQRSVANAWECKLFPMSPAPAKLLELLAARDPGLADLTLALREVVLEEAPEAIELVHDVKYAIALNYTFTGRLKGAFAHIVVYKAHVNLGFYRGAELPDPKKLLEGDGKLIRHLRIASHADLRRRYLRTFLCEAIGRASR